MLYDEDFRALKGHIDAIGTATGSADYEKIVRLARSILKAKSKDLRVAGYLVLGEARHRGAEGMAEALRALQGMLDEYWDDLYPEADRMRARGSALQFVGDRLPDWLASTSFSADDRPALVEAHEALCAIQAFCLEAMGEHAPALSALKSDLEEARAALPDPDESTEASPSDGEPEQNDASTEGLEDTAESDASSGSVVTSATEAGRRIQQAAGYYRQEDLSDPLAYRLLRALRWGGLHSTPPNDQGTTRFEPPRSQRREHLHTLQEKGRYETLVREAESTFQAGNAHVWLDLQRLCAEAFEALGDPFAAARRAVRSELANLLGRVPALPSLAYRDGTPLAGSQTREWIRARVKSEDSPDDQSADRAGPAEEARPAEAQYEQARDQLRGGTLAEALAVITDAAGEDATGKEAFCRRFFVAKLCVEGGRPEIARPVLDQLAASVEERRLETWNPELAVDVWRVRRSCYQNLAQDASPDQSEAYREEAEAAFEAICRVDPAAALHGRS